MPAADAIRQNSMIRISEIRRRLDRIEAYLRNDSFTSAEVQALYAENDCKTLFATLYSFNASLRNPSNGN